MLQQQLESQERRFEQQQQQLQQQLERQEANHNKQLEHQEANHKEQLGAILNMVGKTEPVTSTSLQGTTPSFVPFDSTSELWTDYWARFCTFASAHSVSNERKAQIFLTNQSPATYKLLSNSASQETPPKSINDLTMDEIENYMKHQYDPKRFIVRERFKFWSDMQRKPGETVLELAARIRHAAVTCDFSAIENPLDEALRTRFICSINNEAVLKALFKVKDNDLTFSRAVEIAIETEDAAKVAKETVYGSKPQYVQKVSSRKFQNKASSSSEAAKSKVKCYRCGNSNHVAPDCRFKDAVCNFCKITGHLEKVCRKKAQRATGTRSVKAIDAEQVNSITNGVTSVPKLEIDIMLNNTKVTVELDTATAGNFLSFQEWERLGKPKLCDARCKYLSASKHFLPVRGSFEAVTCFGEHEANLVFLLTDIPGLNLLGRDAIKALGISIDNFLFSRAQAISTEIDLDLQSACSKLCDEYADLFKPELGCLRDVELEIEFKDEAKPIFMKPRPVPFAIQEDLAKAYDAGISKGVWTLTQFNDWGTPVVPIRKPPLPGSDKPRLRVCGDYSVTVNPQLAVHRHPLPLPEELMRKLGGGYGFTKIDLADAYNQVKLGPVSRKRLALSTHKGVLLQNVLPFGISSAPGYFQKIMDDLTMDLPGVAVYLDDILVSGKDAADHFQNLRRLLDRLHSKGLRCKKEKCSFAQPEVEYLGHVLKHDGIYKGHKVDAVFNMPAPKDVSALKSFLGSLQFYAKFLPSNFSSEAEPLYRLTKKQVDWTWGSQEETAFQNLKNLLLSDNVLTHYNPALPIGISCDASSVGIGATLFHRYPDGSERPIANISKILSDSQRNYSQIQKEALAIIFATKKFFQYLFGRKFILVTDHKPLLAIYGKKKSSSGLVANRLARWALFLNQFDFQIEYRNTSRHQNADALSRLPHGEDENFDKEESADDVDIVCAISNLSFQIQAPDPGSLQKETAKDPVLSRVIRFTREGWPQNTNDVDLEKFRKLADSLTTLHGCLLYGTRVVIPSTIRQQVLQLLHEGHFGIQRMKQLARTAVYWPNIDNDILCLCRSCTACAEYQNRPSNPPVHPWMVPEKPWSRLHLDHAINFMGSNWLILVDAYSKYPCIHPTQSTSTKATIDLLEQDFSHFGYPHTIVTDNATCFTSEEFKQYCKERGIIHLTGAPYHPSTNGAAERMVQTFKQALKKSSQLPKKALLDFLQQYRRTPAASGFSPSELLNGRQIRTKIDALLPSPAHITQAQQTKQVASENFRRPIHNFKVGDPCYTLYFGPRRTNDPRWIPAVVIKKSGTRSVQVRPIPHGGVWRRHIDQLRPRYASTEDDEPGDEYSFAPSASEVPDSDEQSADTTTSTTSQPSIEVPPQSPAYGPGNPRRSQRTRKQRQFYGCVVTDY